jgi:hypothetical protein
MNLQNQMLIILCFLIMTLLSACDSGTQQNTQQNNAVQPAAEQSPVRTATVQGSNIDIDDNDIAGIVTSRNGPEAGVWVIAETDAFQTRFTRIVTTDDEGRYLIPDLPDADYTLWVRGYGLTDSNKVYAEPGSHVDLTVVPAPDRATAAEVYPAAYWYAMMHTPDENEISFLEGGLHKYLSIMKNSDCLGCHQLGNKATRTFPAMFAEMDFESSQAAWTRRISSGQAGALDRPHRRGRVAL